MSGLLSNGKDSDAKRQCGFFSGIPTGVQRLSFGQLYTHKWKSISARPSDCDIEVFSSGPPDRAYVEVGVVEGKGTAWKAEFRDLLPAIMEEGCRAGGDGIIIGSMDMSAEGADNVPTQVIQATVIRWTD